MNLQDLSLEITTRLNKLRCISRYLEDQDFIEIWDTLPNKKRKHISRLFRKLKLNEVQTYMKRIAEEKKQWQTITLRHLRIIASKKGIRDYASLDKGSLIQLLEK